MTTLIYGGLAQRSSDIVDFESCSEARKVTTLVEVCSEINMAQQTCWVFSKHPNGNEVAQRLRA